MRERRLIGEVVVVTDHALKTVTSLWPDGVRLEACPVLDEESVARARELGYRESSDERAVWAMTRDHDVAHHLIATAQGLPWSEHLREVAEGRESPEGHREECLALLLQRVNNRGLGGV